MFQNAITSARYSSSLFSKTGIIEKLNPKPQSKRELQLCELLDYSLPIKATAKEITQAATATKWNGSICSIGCMHTLRDRDMPAR